MKLLFFVQSIDKKLNMYKSEFSRVTRQLKLADGLHSLAREVQDSHAYELQCRVRVVRLEKELNALKEEREELKERIYGGAVANVRELNAIDAEYNHVRDKLRKTDKALLEAKNELDNAIQNHEKSRKSLEEREKEWQFKKQDLIKTRDSLGFSYKKLKSEYSDRVDNVPKALLSTYKKLLNSTNGTPIAKIVEGVCQGCFIKLPLNDLENIKKSQKMLRCSTCNRIILFD